MNDWLSSPAAAEAAVILVSLALGYLLGDLAVPVVLTGSRTARRKWIN